MQMQIESAQSTGFLRFNTKTFCSPLTENDRKSYFNKHWQVVEKSIEIFILSKPPINLVAFSKSLGLLVLHYEKERIKIHLAQLWEKIFSQILSDIQGTEKSENPLISLLEHYKTIQYRFKIIFTLLQSSLRKGTQRDEVDMIDEESNLRLRSQTIPETEAFEILCKLILKSPLREKYEEEMLLLIDAFRRSTYSEQNVVSEEICRGEVLLNLLIVKKIGLFTTLEDQFYLSSKNFYVQMSQQIPRDSREFLFIVNQFLEREIDLNSIFEPKENTVAYIEKELIRQFYNEILDNLLEQSIKEYVSLKQRQKCQKQLEIFWKFTLRVGEEAIKNLCGKFKEIITGGRIYIEEAKLNKEKIFELISFRDNLIQIVSHCFNKNRKITNHVYNCFQELLYENEKDYLLVSLQNYLQENPYSCDKMEIEENENPVIHELSVEERKYLKLFQISPSKQNFVKELQVRFCRWVLSKGFEMRSLEMQHRLFQQMKKEVGHNLMKKVDRMLHDVWRDNRMHFQHQVMENNATLKCMLLSGDWPTFISVVFNIPDELYEMSVEFERTFKKAPENAHRELRWVDEMSSVVISIRGVVSTVSQLEAAILMLLGKSIRPLKKDQIEASLSLCLMGENPQELTAEGIFNQNLEALVSNSLVVYDADSGTFDLNQENKVSYKYEKANEEKGVETIKKNNPAKDDTILVEAAIVKILKKRKHMQRGDISRFIEETVKKFKPTFEQVTKAFETLETREFISINRNKGIISYVE